MSGKIFVVSTPIGNLEDLSPRATKALSDCDIVACEDTRHSGMLLARLGIKKRFISLHEHNERRRLPQLMELLEQGLVVAVISDAGTPMVSDPGFLLMREAAQRGIRIEPIPGPSAFLAALVASALPPYPFTFCGFPPPSGKRRRRFYRKFKDLGHTLIFYESPHRLLSSLTDAESELGGERPAAVCRELTKLHEETRVGTAGELATHFSSAPRGEITLVIDAASAVVELVDDRALTDGIALMLDGGLSPRSAAGAVTALGLMSRNAAYALATEIASGRSSD